MTDPYDSLPDPYFRFKLNRAGVRGRNGLHTQLEAIAKLLGFGRLTVNSNPRPKTNGTGLHQVSEITPEHIAAETAKIRSEWDERTELLRRVAGCQCVPAVIPGAEEFALVQPHEGVRAW